MVWLRKLKLLGTAIDFFIPYYCNEFQLIQTVRPERLNGSFAASSVTNVQLFQESH